MMFQMLKYMDSITPLHIIVLILLITYFVPKLKRQIDNGLSSVSMVENGLDSDVDIHQIPYPSTHNYV